MHPYWISTDNAALAPMGVGITASSPEDALKILDKVFRGEVCAAGIQQLRDVWELDAGHVVPNMGNLLKRGVWFPLGYEKADLS